MCLICSRPTVYARWSDNEGTRGGGELTEKEMDSRCSYLRERPFAELVERRVSEVAYVKGGIQLPKLFRQSAELHRLKVCNGRLC